jgi:hypothetical protein
MMKNPAFGIHIAEVYAKAIKVCLTRISHQLSTAKAYPGMSTALRSVGLLDVLSSTPAGPSVARLVSMPVCASSL